MKKSLLTALLVIVTVFAYAQTVQKTYYFETPMVSEVNGYDVIRFAETYNIGIPGEAALPYQKVSLLLPQNTEAQNITVEYSDFVELEGTYNILPQQKARPLSSTEPLVFEKNEDFYRSENMYPEVTYSRANTQYLNGCSFAFAQFTPVRYVPATGKVSYAKSATVTIDVTASRSDRSNMLWMTPEVQSRVERLAQNPEAVTAYKNRARTIGGYELLVITPQEWVSHFDEYVEFYEARGLRTHVTALEDILANFDGRDDPEKMRTYITQEYENEGIMMVLLGGDSNVVPWRALWCKATEEDEDNLPADMYFVCLDGTWNDDNDDRWGEVGEDDLLPELGVGRMPFNNETQFNNMMHKTLEYQVNPVLGEFQTVILGAEHLGDGYYGSHDLDRLIGENNDFDYTTIGIPEDYEFIKIYADGPTGWGGGLFRKTINQNGGQYVHHVGHANTGIVAGWEVQYTNDASFEQLDGVHHNYNFFHSHGCICGDFTATCILERLVNISTGFVAVTGNSRYGWYVPWGDGMAAHLHREFVDAYYHDRLPYIGTAFVEMKIMTAPYVAEPWGDNGCLRWNIYDINILGDVAVCPWLDEPFRPEVNYESALTQGTTTTPVTITQRGLPLSNFRCSIFHNGDLLAFGETDTNGIANVDFDGALDVADTLKLIITGPNAWPQTINIIGLNDNTAYVYPQDIDIHGGFVSGTDISMDIDFRNAGTIDADNVTATLSTDSNIVTLTKSTVEVGTVGAGETVTLTDAFDVEVAAGVSDGTYVDFVVTCTDGTNVWNRDVFFQVIAPVMNIKELSYEEVSGNMNGFIDPGETIRIKVKGKNNGHYIAENPHIQSAVNSDYMTIVNNDLYFNDVEAGESFEEYVELQISDATPDGTSFTVSIDLLTGPYSDHKNITLTVGTVIESFETADFSHLEWQQEGHGEWFVTDTVAHEGVYSAQSPELAKNQYAMLSVEIETTTDGELKFYYKTNIKQTKAALVIYLDDEAVDMFYGNSDWTLYTLEIKAGYHTIAWGYHTATSGNVSGNVCWIDDITFPGNTVVLDDVEDIQSANEVSVYPNPANDVVYLTGDGIQYVEIYNAIGMRVFAKSINDSESIDIAQYASGVYFVRTFDDKGNVSITKLIKK